MGSLRYRGGLLFIFLDETEQFNGDHDAIVSCTVKLNATISIWHIPGPAKFWCYLISLDHFPCIYRPVLARMYIRATLHLLRCI